MNRLQSAGLSILAALLAACNVTEPGPAAPAPLPEPVESASEEALPAPAPSPDTASIVRQMLIADTLFAAREAYDANRLMMPLEDNAYDRYRRVLTLDPGNRVALEGLREIVTRYVALADNAMTIGQFEEAKEMLERGAMIDADNDMLREARGRLEEARKTRVEYFALDERELRAQSELIKARLGEIGRLLRREEGATFLITAGSDREARWIYRIMREAVEGYRLRGNIVVGDSPSVQVQIPTS